jgi:hypothetical protein
MWFNLATTSIFDSKAKAAAEKRDDLAKKMTPDDISAAQTLAREWSCS